jgi:hypothetical protein
LLEDETRLLLRIRLDNDRARDLSFASTDASSAFLDALAVGEISVVRCQIPLTDVNGELEELESGDRTSR